MISVVFLCVFEYFSFSISPSHPYTLSPALLLSNATHSWHWLIYLNNLTLTICFWQITIFQFYFFIFLTFSFIWKFHILYFGLPTTFHLDVTICRDNVKQFLCFCLFVSSLWWTSLFVLRREERLPNWNRPWGLGCGNKTIMCTVCVLIQIMFKEIWVTWFLKSLNKHWQQAAKGVDWDWGKKGRTSISL